MSAGYETFFGLSERPFSLTSDPRYFFRSRAHGRALETLTFGLRSRVRFLSLTGDLGIGKTMFCRTLCDQIRRTVPVVYVGNPLLSPDAFERLLMEDLALSTFEALDAMTDDAVIVVDEAHSLPDQLLSHLLSLSRRHIDNEYLFRFVFVGQPMFGDPSRLGIAEIDDRVSTRVRLLPLGREECTAYIEHRLSMAGLGHRAHFSTRTHDYVFSLSGGVPRLVNLLCERALQEAAALGTSTIEPRTVDAAAAALELLCARPRRFRWFNRRLPCAAVPN
jgi:general secretion pathway protein A